MEQPAGPPTADGPPARQAAGPSGGSADEDHAKSLLAALEAAKLSTQIHKKSPLEVIEALLSSAREAHIKRLEAARDSGEVLREDRTQVGPLVA